MKDTVFKFRVSKEDLAVIKERAASVNMTVSKYVTTAALKPITKIDGIKEFTNQLRKIGVNLNQITVLCHQGKIKSVKLEETQQELSNLWRELSELRKAVRENSNH